MVWGGGWPMAINPQKDVAAEINISISRKVCMKTSCLQILHRTDGLLLFNFNNLTKISLIFSYLNTSVINLLQKFQQNSLFGNVNLDMRLRDGSIPETLSHLLPLIDNLNSIQGENIAQLVAFDNANSYSEMAMGMLKMARFLAIL
jgi:hypothetical protein